MSCKATLHSVSLEGGFYTITFSNGSGINGTREDILAWMAELYDNPEMAKRAALGKAFAQDPNFLQISSVQGKAVVLDPSHVNSIRIDANDSGTGMISPMRIQG
jgi:hypothetical protein